MKFYIKLLISQRIDSIICFLLLPWTTLGSSYVPPEGNHGTVTCSSAPNVSKVLQRIVSQNPNILPKTQTFRREGYFPVEGRLDFVDKAMAELRKTDKRWKYAKHHGATMSEYIAYACSDDPTDAVFIEVVGLARFSNPRVSRLIWRNQTKAHGRHPGYKALYPRPGGPDPEEGGDDEGGGRTTASCSSSSASKPTSASAAEVASATSGNPAQLPDVRSIVEKLKREHPEAWSVAYNSFQGSYSKERIEFLDRTVQKLHSLNPRFGYVKPDGRSSVNPRALCYSIKSSTPYMGSRSGNGENWHVDFVPEPGHGKNLIWVKRPAGWSGFEGSIDSCIYPRPGAHDYGYGSEEEVCVTDDGGDDEEGDATNPQSVKGQCGSWKGKSDASCTAGKFHPHPPDTAQEYRWTCRNIPHNGKASCKEARNKASETQTQGDSRTTNVATDCRTLRIQIPALQRQLGEQMKAYSRGGGRLKKWFGLRRGSCKNVQLCETLANTIHLAANNPSMASRLDSYKKRFRKNCKNFDRCRGIASAMTQIKKDLNESVRTYNLNCRR